MERQHHLWFSFPSTRNYRRLIDDLHLSLLLDRTLKSPLQPRTSLRFAKDATEKTFDMCRQQLRCFKYHLPSGTQWLSLSWIPVQYCYLFIFPQAQDEITLPLRRPCRSAPFSIGIPTRCRKCSCPAGISVTQKLREENSDFRSHSPADRCNRQACIRPSQFCCW